MEQCNAVGGRRSGKSLEAARKAVQWCAGTGQGVAVFSEDAKNRIMEEAARQGVQIPEPVVVKLNSEKPVRGETFAGIIVDYEFKEENKMKKYTKGMTFGDALEAMKDGEKVAREGWNGKNMFVFLAHDADFVTDADLTGYDQPEVPVADMIVMKTAQDTFQPGWLASQADMLAEDWFVVE